MAGTPMQSREFTWDQTSSFEDWCKDLNGEGWYLDVEIPRRETSPGKFTFAFFQLIHARTHVDATELDEGDRQQ
ncbi:MAG: hypothetical protein Q7K25_01440 [Actinomycetota bacterium]|nr:hypothetical protein [Actinomycetota bacterium]